MNKKRVYFLTLMSILSFSLEIAAQDFTLKLSSVDTIENSFLSKINFIKSHKDSISIYNELSRVHKLIQLNGYFLNSLDSVVLNQKKYSAFLNLNEKVDSVALSQKNFSKQILAKFNFRENILKLPIKELERILNKISEAYEEEGNSFSKVNLENFSIKDKRLYADIYITKSIKRKINKLIFKGYDNFPSSFIKNFFNINKETLFNKKKLNEISKLSQTLDFASEIKPPETLFMKDSTFVYIYLKKDQGNSFDGLINFSSQENGKLQFNGYLDLKLKNILNTGEKFNLLWNRFGNERQEFLISTEIPYIFNSKLSPELNFSIYKQDSTFLNTKFNTKIQYQIKSKSTLFLTFSSENSEKLTNTLVNNVETFTSSFLGFGYQYNIPKNDLFRNNVFFLNINPSFGKRKINDLSINQIKLESTISYLLALSKRNSIFLKNKSGLLNSENYIDNELFRIGGNNSIRGFNEQSIFVKDYIIQNIEYRYRTSEDSYLYSITDLALVSNSNKKEKLIGLGLGYLFNSNNSQINISTAIGTNTKAPINIKNTQFFVNWVNYF